MMTWKTSVKEKRLKQNLSSLLTSWREPKKVYVSCSDALNSSSEMYLMYKQELYSLAARGIHLNNDDQMINLVSVDGGQDLLLYSHTKQKLRLFKIVVEKFQRPDMGNQWTYKPVVTTLIDLHVQIEPE